MVEIRWVWLFLHHEEGEGGARASEVDRAWDFWQEVSGQSLSARRGERGEFATLLPADGDGWIKLQRTLVGDGIHLDLVVDDVDAAATEAVRLRAELVDAYRQVRVLTSPGGFTFCFTSWESEGRPRRQVRAGPALLDQACLDIPPERYEVEVGFWTALTGWDVARFSHQGFRALVRPERMPVRLLLQRLDSPSSHVTGHPDVACTDRSTATGAWTEAGAEVVAEHEWWTVMRDPAGQTFCLTDRLPETGLVR